MKKIKFYCLAVLLTFTTFASAGVSKVGAVTTSIEDMIAGMTLEQKITQMLMPDFRQWNTGSGNKDLTEMNSEVAQIISDYDFGGIILFANNVKGTEQTLALTTAMQKAQLSTNTIPLLTTVDQEGGIVYRLGSGTALPGNMALGATRNPQYARQVGQVIGRELDALGINVNFAPSFDVNNNPLNPVIGLRSISSDPKVVSELGVEMMQGMQEYNIATSAKHFPGHGDTATDSHTGLPLVNKTYEELKEMELIPFQAAVDNGVDMLMTAHIQYPQIETETAISKLDGTQIHIPATLSKGVITGVVRNKMGFDGIVITDALNMDAISKHFGESEAVIMAIKADVDILLMPTILRSNADLAKLDTMIADVKTAVTSGEIEESSIDKSVERILKLKVERGIIDLQINDSEWGARLAKANQEVGSQLNRDIEREIARAAVTVTKNTDTILPMNPKADEKVLLMAPYDNELPGMKLAINRLKAEGNIPNDVAVEYVRYSGTSTINDFKAQIDASNYVVVISEIGSQAQLAQTNWLTKMPTDIINYANEAGVDAAVLSISKPYDTSNYPNAKAVAAVYGNKGMDPTEGLQPDAAFGPNIPAGIEVIFGHAAQGKLPVMVPVIENNLIDVTRVAYPLGHGITYTDPVSGIEVALPASVEMESTFEANVNLGDLEGLSKQDYQVRVEFNDADFSAVAPTTRASSYQIDGNEVVFNVPANTTPTLAVQLNGVRSGENMSPINSIRVVDAKSRTFSMGDGYYAGAKLSILNKTTQGGGNNNNNGSGSTDKDKDVITAGSINSGDQTNTTAMMLLLLVSVLAVAGYAVKKRANK